MTKKWARSFAKYGVPCCLMHNRGRTAIAYAHSDICADLEEEPGHRPGRGIDPDQIILDRGIGFGKTYEQKSCGVIHHLEELNRFDLPILLLVPAVSRHRSDAGSARGGADGGTLVTTVLAVEKGLLFCASTT